MTLEVLFRNLEYSLVHPDTTLGELAATDASEAQLFIASEYLESIYGDGNSCASSRAQTPLSVSNIPRPATSSSFWSSCKTTLGLSDHGSPTRLHIPTPLAVVEVGSIRPVNGIARITRSPAKPSILMNQETMPTIIYPSLPKLLSAASTKRILPRLSSLPQEPSLEATHLAIDPAAEYAIVLSMYEVYNNRICDLLQSTGAASMKFTSLKDTWKPALLFKSTEFSPDCKVVAGLKKIVCGSLDEALLVLEAGLTERTVAGTGSNATSSRSHGFFCIEIKKRRKGSMNSWSGSTLTIADLAGILLATPSPIPT